MNRSASVGLLVFVVVIVCLGASGSAVTVGVASGSSAGTAADTSADGDGVAAIDAVAGADSQQLSTGPQSQLQSQPQTQTRQSPDATSQHVSDSGTFDSTTFEITVHENGSATWTFRYGQQLDESDENATNSRENFEAFAEEFESEETDLYENVVNQSHSLANTDHDHIDREMEASNFDRDAWVDEGINTMGVVEISFRWDGFAAHENGTLVVGDVFQDLFLFEDQSITVQADDDLTVQSVDPAPDERSSLGDTTVVEWEGEEEFLPGHPQVVFDHPDDSSSGSDGLSAAIPGDRSELWLLALLAGLGIVGGGLWYYYRSGDESGTGSGTGTGSGSGSVPSDGTAVQPPDENSEAPSSSAAASPTTSASAGAASNSSSADGDPGSAVDADRSPSPEPLSEEELLTDEDRVVELIRENGGRMKQVNIVDETGWSKSKVSMLLSEMEDEGTISKLRVGRENIISLEGFEPEATKSPFEE